MKKPEIKVVRIDSCDVITTSGKGSDEGSGIL